MKKKFIVVSIFEMPIQDAYNKGERHLLVECNEGVFDSRIDAMERLTGMIEEERQNDDEMYFDIKEVYSK
jgi:hypothetical protein